MKRRYFAVSLKPDRKTADKTAKINSDGRASRMTRDRTGAGKNGLGKNGPEKNGPAEKAVLSFMVCAVIRVRLTSYHLGNIRHT